MGNKKPSTLNTGVQMKRVLLVATILGFGLFPAKADLVLEQGVFADLGAAGFGNAPRLLNIQNNGSEAGGSFALPGGGTGFFTGLPAPGLGGLGTICTNNATCNNQPQVEVDKTFVYSVGALGWTSGAKVGIGLDTNETGGTTALTFNSLVLTLYNSAGVALANFSGSQPINISQALLNIQQGNGNAVFNIGLSPAEQTLFNNTLIAAGCTIGVACNTVFEGLSASFGTGLPGQVCPGAAIIGGFPSPGGCFASTDGQESFLAFAQVPGPIVGAGLPGLIASLLGMVGLNRYRKRRVA